MKSEQHKNYGKIKGIYINYSGNIDETYIVDIVKHIKKINYCSLSHKCSSVHHVNFIFNEDKDIEKITLGFRPLGVKPEDIDGLYLEHKKNSAELSPYENLLYELWKYHFDKGKTEENKILDTIYEELYKFKNNKDSDKLQYKTLDFKEKEKFKEECKKIINLIKTL